MQKFDFTTKIQQKRTMNFLRKCKSSIKRRYFEIYNFFEENFSQSYKIEIPKRLS
ncbi:hypothetical protein LEP1GSC008_1158 [Leptospira kirschneri serovar Bulgarica str. Nikolaevo]|uniref:Uncharacterized protein n=1 Tax=Leptospira kirschneri serovar Bulgarica str. Nikolaevo TaxID=1240687 RepID=M6F5K6_9LEPT|nr:hypothetical protein LEP1GSC008_1158 [Leptospira kirschneri serovar Bulgarica str. Nikolaevo]